MKLCFVGVLLCSILMMWSTSAAAVVGEKIIERKLFDENPQPVVYSSGISHPIGTPHLGAPATGISDPISAPAAGIDHSISAPAAGIANPISAPAAEVGERTSGFNYEKASKVAKFAAVVGGIVLERQINKQNEKTEKLSKIASIASKVPEYLGK